MSDCLLRHYMELFYLFDRQNVSIKDLTAEFHCTKKTIISDIAVIMQLASQYGTAVIEDEFGFLHCQIINEMKYYELATRAIAFFYKHRNNYEEYLRRTQVILLHSLLLGVNDHESLSEKLSFSSSALRLEFKKAKQFIATYQLPNDDYFIAKDLYPEFNKRQALSSALCLVDPKVVPFHTNTEIDSFCQFINRQDTSQNLIKIRNCLKKYQVSLSKDNILKLSIYLAIQKYQIEHRQIISVLPLDISVILATQEYPVARELYNLYNQGKNSIEICSVAMLLLIYNETFELPENSHFKPIFEPFLDQIYTEILSLFNNDWNLHYDDQLYEYSLKRELSRILSKREFNVLGFKNDSIGEDEFHTTHSEDYLSNTLLSEIGMILERVLKVQIYNNDLYPIIKLIQLHLLHHQFALTPLSVLINFRSGKMQEVTALAILKKNFAFFQNITFECSFNKQKTDHSIILCDYEEKPIPGIQYLQTYNGIGPHILSELKKLCAHSLDLSASLPQQIQRQDRKEASVLLLRNALHEEYQIPLKDPFSPVREISKQFGHTYVFLYHDQDIKSDFLICGKLEKTIAIEKQTYDSYLFLVLCPSVEKLLVYASFFKDYQYHHGVKDSFFNDPTRENFRSIVMNSLQNAIVI